MNRASLDRESLDRELWNSTTLMNEMIFFLSTGFYNIKFRLGTFSFLRKSGKMFEIFFVVFKVSRFTILQFLSKKRFRHSCFTVSFAIKAFVFETFTNYSIRFQCTLSQSPENIKKPLCCLNLCQLGYQLTNRWTCPPQKNYPVWTSVKSKFNNPYSF